MKNQMNQATLLYTALVVILLFTSWLVPEDYNSLTHRKTNILSELTRERKEQLTGEVVLPSDLMVWSTEFLQDHDSLAGFAAHYPPSQDPLHLRELSFISDKRHTPIVDFSNDSTALRRFSHKLGSADRAVRIAFLGDSYCEGDILTADLREQLQSLYGGRGVGFIPFSPIDEWRKTATIRSSGWQTYNAIFTKSIDRSLLWLNNQYYFPTREAKFSLAFTQAKNHIDSVSRLSLLFRNEGDSRLLLRVNSEATQKQTLQPSKSLQLLHIDRPAITRFDLSFEQAEQFVGIGLFANDTTGVYVDNYSLRSANGNRQAWVDPALAADVQHHYPVDLIILQYGLNVAYVGEKQYTSYRQRMVETIRHLQRILPEADILLLSVGDRSTRIDGRMQTMDGIQAMVEAQRDIAQQANIAFWNLFDAMGGAGSMVQFVESPHPMAAKDYTHINYAGGKQIAIALTNALIQEKRRHE